jgi:hypothetical protein
MNHAMIGLLYYNTKHCRLIVRFVCLFCGYVNGMN